jgi:hypothetical protein
LMWILIKPSYRAISIPEKLLSMTRETPLQY